MSAWIEAAQGKKNIYFHPNVVPRMTDKAKKSDVVAAVCLHADIDPREGRSKEDIIAELKGFTPAYSVLVDSGNGCQALWRFDQPVPLDAATLSAVEAMSQELAARLGGDACHSVDHLLRLPGT